MNKSIELVVLDMAGTTVRDEKEVERCFARALNESGLDIDPGRILALQGWSKIRVFEMLWKEHLGVDSSDLRDRVQATYRRFREILEAHYEKHPASPQPHVEETFHWLRDQGIKIALTTGFYRKVTDLILSQLGWDKGLDKDHRGGADSVIDLSLCSDDVESGRPAPDMIRLAMERLDVQDPERVINIGDTPSDLASGIAAEVKWSLGVLNGTHSSEQLKEYENNGLIRDLSELRSMISSTSETAAL